MESVNDLGITLSNNFKWSEYVSKISSKANVVSYSILRSFRSRDISLFINLFKIYVRPLLEYNSSIWNSLSIFNQNQIESVQRRFTKIICQKTNTKFSDYQDRLKLLQLDSLEIRRFKTDLIIMYKIYNGIIDVDFEAFFINSISNRNYTLRGHKKKIQPPKYSGSTVRQNFFSNRNIFYSNKLPKSIVEAPNLKIFKSALELYDVKNIYITKFCFFFFC